MICSIYLIALLGRVDTHDLWVNAKTQNVAALEIETNCEVTENLSVVKRFGHTSEYDNDQDRGYNYAYVGGKYRF